PSHLLENATYQEHPLVVSWLKNPKIPTTREFLAPAPQDEKPYLGAYHALNRTSAAIFVEVPKDAAFSAAQRLIRSSGFLAILVFLGSWAVGMLFALSITRPLKALRDLTHRIAQGQF